MGWRCEACNKSYETCEPTYIVQAKIADVSGEVTATFYRDAGEQLMGVPAKRLREMKDVDGDVQLVSEVFAERAYRPISCLLRLKEQRKRE